MRAAAYALIAAGVVLSVAAALPAAWAPWEWSQPIEVAEGATGLIAVDLPPLAYAAGGGSLADVRVIDSAGDERPYVLHVPVERRTREWRTVAVGERSFVPGDFTQLVADVGGSLPHNVVELQFDDTDFFARVEIAVSDDAQLWRVLREQVPVYRFTGAGRGEATEVAYETSRSRWLRVRLLGTERRVGYISCRVALELRIPGELRPLGVPAKSDSEGTTRALFEFDAAALPVSAVDFATARAAFHRRVDVEARSTDGSWRPIGSGQLIRQRVGVGDDGPVLHERLRVTFPETRERHWRVTIHNGNDPPIDDLAPQLLGVPRRVVFEPPGAQARLIYGNPRAALPVYEIARLVSDAELRAAQRTSLGAVERNAGWVSGEPWSERHPWLLGTALVAALALLGLLALRALRRESSAA